jgi:hypothetical protein
VRNQSRSPILGVHALMRDGRRITSPADSTRLVASQGERKVLHRLLLEVAEEHFPARVRD